MTNPLSAIQRPGSADGYAKAPGVQTPGADLLSRVNHNQRVPGDVARLGAALTFAGLAVRSLAGSGREVAAMRLMLRATAMLLGRSTSAEQAATYLRNLAEDFVPPSSGSDHGEAI